MMGTDDHRPRPTGKTNLMAACEQGRTLEVKIILQKKPLAVASRDRNGKTALHYCAESGSVACAQLILSADPTLLNLPDEDGFTPLHLAIIAGNRSVARLLLKHGADPDRMDKERHSTVHWAAVCGDVESLELLLNHGTNPSCPDILGAYPVHYAAQMCGSHSLNGKDPETGLNILKKLVQRGASIQCRDRDGREPLLWAASTGSSEAVLILFAAGASITSADKDGLTALHCAASRGHTSCVETLVTLCGARINAGDSIGCSPLFYAAAQGHADSVQVLLKYSADPNLQDDKGRTPAHCAASKGQLEILRILDSNGADLWIRNSRGNLPLHEAVQSGRKDLVQWLLGQCPRAVNATNINGRTPLHIAAQKNNVEMCEVLIDYGAHINPLMVNAKGFLMSPLDAAVYQGNQRCAKYLQLHGAVPATKVLENNEINRNLLFSLGNYAYSQKERSDEELASATTLEQMRGLVQTDPGPILHRDTQTRTIRAGQQPPLPQAEVPPESLLTNVTSEDITDASVHIHLSRDDLWSLWESLMQELTSEMSEDREGSEASSEGKVKRKSSEVRQLKPILTNVYLRTSSTRNQQDVIAGESILDKSIPMGVTDDDDTKPKTTAEGSRRRRHSRSTRDDLKTTLAKVAEVDNSSNQELDEKLNNSSHENKKGHREHPEAERTDLSAQNDYSDSVGSDTEHRSALMGVKVTRLRKRRSDGRTWGKEPEESETSSGHRPEQREANPYLKRYFQKQARAAEMRNYLSGMADEGGPQDEDQQQPKSHHKSYKHVVREDYDDVFYSKHRRRSSRSKQNLEDDNVDEVSTHKGVEGHKRKHWKKPLKEDVNAKGQSVNDVFKNDEQEEDDQIKSSKRRSRTIKNHPEDYKSSRKIKCECMSPVQDSSLSPKSRSGLHSETNDEESPDRVRSGSRKGSSHFLEVPHQANAAPAKSDDEDKSGEAEQILKNKLHHHYHHHHHHHHHHHRPPLEKNASLHDEYQHFTQHRKHRRHYHRKRSRLREKRGSTDTVKEARNLSDGEYNFYGRDNRPPSVEEKRSKSEMSGLPRLNIKDTLSLTTFKEQIVPISEDEIKHLINEEERFSATETPVDENILQEHVDSKRHPSHMKESIDNEKVLHESMKSELSTNKVSQVLTSDGERNILSSKEDTKTSAVSRSKKQDKLAASTQKDTKISKAAVKSQDKKSESQAATKKRESKSKTRSPKGTDKVPVEKSGVRRVSLGTKRRSPKKELGKSTPKPLKTAYSMSELLPNKANGEDTKQKSRSAQIQKSSLLPDIRLFSVEGDPTYLLHKEEANTSRDIPEKLSEQVNADHLDHKCEEESVKLPEPPDENQTQHKVLASEHENEETCKDNVEQAENSGETKVSLNEDTAGRKESRKKSSTDSSIKRSKSPLKPDADGMEKTHLSRSSRNSRRMSVTPAESSNEADFKSDAQTDVENIHGRKRKPGDEEDYSRAKSSNDTKSLRNSVLEISIPNDDANLNEGNVSSEIHNGRKSVATRDNSTEDEAVRTINNIQADQKLEAMLENDTGEETQKESRLPMREKETTERNDGVDAIQDFGSELKEFSSRPHSSAHTDKATHENESGTEKKMVDLNEKDDIEKDADSVENESIASSKIHEQNLKEGSENKNEDHRKDHEAESIEKIEENGKIPTKNTNQDGREKEKYQHDEENSIYDEEGNAVASKDETLLEYSDLAEKVGLNEHKIDESKEPVKESVVKDEGQGNSPDDTEFQNAETDTEQEPVGHPFDDDQEFREVETSLQTVDDDQVITGEMTQFVVPENIIHLPTDESASEAETKFETDESDEIQPEPDITKLLLLSEDSQHSPPIEESEAIAESNLADTKERLAEIQRNEIADHTNDTNHKDVILDSDGKLLLPLNANKIGSEKAKSSKYNAKEQEKNKVPEPLKQSEDSSQNINIDERQMSPKLIQTDADINDLQRLESTPTEEHKPAILRRDMSSQTFSVRGETDFYHPSKASESQTRENEIYEAGTQSNQDPAEIHRSISVQTMNAADTPSKSRRESLRIPGKTISQNTVSVQTDDLLKVPDTNETSEEGHRSRRRQKENDESDKSSREKKPDADEASEMKTENGSTKSSPERHNPSAVFYQTKSGESSLKSNKKPQETKTHNRSALFYTTPAIRERNLRKSDSLARSESLENSNKKNSESKTNRRSSIRDRSLESEKAVAIANSAFRKLNSNGELTVFNSSLIIPSGNNQNGSSFHFDNSQKSSCQRRGEYPSLEKPGFLWVHFGSGSSPIHTLKRKPAFTSQNLKREKTMTIPEKAGKIDKSPDKKPGSNFTPKMAGMSKKPEIKQGSKNVYKAEAEKVPKRKRSIAGSAASSIPALQATSKVLNNKNTDRSTKTKEVKKESHEQTPQKLTISMHQASHLKTAKDSSEKSTHKVKSDASAPRTETLPKKESQANKGSPKTSMTSQEKTLKSQSRSPRKGNTKGAEDATTVTETGNGRKEGNKDDSPKRGIKSSKVAKDEENKDNKDKNNKAERLTETAKSSSLDEGDVRLVIERKTVPGVSIKIKMKDGHKKNKHKNTDVVDLSSTQGESDQSYVKDSGYISTSESIHKHRRSITIDLGHTTAKINAGMKSSSFQNTMSKEKTFLLPSVSNNGEDITQNGDIDDVRMSEKSVKKTLPSKLPILESHRQRSNSLVFMDYNRSPRRDSLTSSEISVESIRSSNLATNKSTERRGSFVSTLHLPGSKEALQGEIQRQAAKSPGRSPLPRRRSSIPIYKAYSDGNLHSSKPSPRLGKHSLSTPSVHESTTEGKGQSSPRKMSSIRELSTSPGEMRHSDTEIQLKSAEKLKLPSILLYEPEDGHSSEKETGEEKFPNIQRSHLQSRSKAVSPLQEASKSAASVFSTENMSLKLPLLQQVVKCRCNIQPYQHWDGRRTRSAVDCVANVHFLSEEEMAEFDSRFSPLAGRKSFSGDKKRRTSPHPHRYRALKTQTLKRLNAGRLSADKAVTFHVDHARERNTFKLPTEKLEKNKKWQVVFTIAKSKEKKQKSEES